MAIRFRGLVLTVGVIIFVFALAAIIFISTFDINRYKPILVEKFSQFTHKDVELERISLDFSHGPGCKIYGLVLKEKDVDWDDGWLKVEEVVINPKILPLLKKDIQINYIEIKGLELKLSDGLLQSIMPTPEGKLATYKKDGLSSAGFAFGALKFLANVVLVKDSIITYTSERINSPLKLHISELLLNNLSMDGPLRVSGVFSTRDGYGDIILKCIVFPQLKEGKPYIKNLELKVNLKGLDIPQILNLLGYGQFAEQLEDKKFSGNIVLNAERIFLDPKSISDSEISFRISDFFTDMVMIEGGLRILSMEGGFSKERFVIRNCSGKIGRGTFLLKGVIDGVFSSRHLDLELFLNNLELKDFFVKGTPSVPYLQGLVDLKINISGNGFEWNNFTQGLSGTGSFGLNEGRLVGMNILRFTFDKMDMIPGLVEKLKGALPERYEDILKQPDTNFKPIKISFRIKDGWLIFQEGVIESDGFFVNVKGGIGLSGDVSMEPQLFIEKDLSMAFIKIVKELRFLRDEKGMINMPLKISGRIPQISIGIDRDYVISKLLISKGTELLGRIFEKKDDSEKTQPQDEMDASSEEIEEIDSGVDKTKELLKSIIDIFK